MDDLSRLPTLQYPSFVRPLDVGYEWYKQTKELILGCPGNAQVSIIVSGIRAILALYEVPVWQIKGEEEFRALRSDIEAVVKRYHEEDLTTDFVRFEAEMRELLNRFRR